MTARGGRAWLAVGVGLLLTQACDSAGDSVCVSSDTGEVCADGSSGSIKFSGSGLEPGSEVRLESDELEPIVLRATADGELDPNGAVGVMAMFAGTEFTFSVVAIDAQGDSIEGDLVVST